MEVMYIWLLPESSFLKGLQGFLAHGCVTTWQVLITTAIKQVQTDFTITSEEYVKKGLISQFKLLPEDQ